MADSPVITALKKQVTQQPVAKSTVPLDRKTYIRDCRDNIAKFRATYPTHWSEYIRSDRRPPDYHDLLELKSWLREHGKQHMMVGMLLLAHRLANQKLASCRRPRGVVIAAIVLEKLYISYSLCNFAAGDQWNKYIALWKAMKRIEKHQTQDRPLTIKPCPVVGILSEGKEDKLVLADYKPSDLIEWLEQFPSSARKSAVRLARRIFEQHFDDKSITPTDLLPIIP